MEKPFIHFLQSPNSGYFYDVNKNEIVSVNGNVFTYLYSLMTGKACAPSAKVLETVDSLRENGYLSSRRVKEIRHPYSQYLSLFLERKLEKITLQLTQNCNFRCKYCIYSETSNPLQRGHSSKHMEWKTVKQGIDFFWAHSVDSAHVNIGFYGGEPLLEFNLIKQATAYAEERFRGKDLSLNMTTNGSLLTDEIVCFLEEHSINTMISLDGPKEINDKNRVFSNGGGTFDTVIGKIRNISEKRPEFAKKLQLSMVIDPQNDFDCLQSVIVECSKLNISNLNSTIVDNDYNDSRTEFSNRYIEEYNYQAFLAYLAYLGRIDKDEVSLITYQGIQRLEDDIRLMRPMEGLPEVAAPSGPCVPGQHRLFVNADGNFYPCERVSECSAAMRIGNLTDGFDVDAALQILNVGALTSQECTKCWALHFCGACAKAADNGTSLSAERKLSHCKQIKANAHAKLLQIILIKEAPHCYSSSWEG